MSAFSLASRSAPRSAALLIGALVSPTAFAAEEPRTGRKESVELPPTVVTAVAPASPLTIVADPKAPRQPLPATDGADYLKTIPGFSAIRNGGSNGDPVLRGMFGSRLNILANGGQIIGACPGRMDAPTAYISPQSYDRLVVIKGPQTVQWGPGASAGTVRFERDPEAFATPGARLDASVLAGSNGRFERRVDTAAGTREGYARFIANDAQADDYQAGNGDTVPSRWRKWNGDMALGWTPDPDTLVELSAGHGDGEARYAGRGMDGASFKRESLGLRLERHGLGDVFEGLEAQFYYNYADHVMDNYSLRTPPTSGMMPGPRASNVDRRTLGGRIKGTWAWQTLDLVAGLDGQTSEHRKRAAPGEGAYKAIPRERDAVMNTFGTFAELTWAVTDQSRWLGGARLDHATARDYRATLGSGMARRTNPTAGHERNETLPSGFIRFEHDLQQVPLTAYAGLGHAQRFPDYWELYSPAQGPAGSANAFTGIRPEKTTQLDTGLHYRAEHVEAWVSAYAGQVKDYILFDYNGGQSTARNISAHIAGGELGGAWHFNEHWKADATLAYAWGKNRSDGTALAQMPPLDTRLGLSYQQNQWRAGALWRLVSAQHRTDPGRGNVVGKDYRSTPGFGVFSLNGAVRLSPHLKVSAGVDNLFAKTYAEHLNLAGNAGFGYPGDALSAIDEPGRTLWTQLDLSF
ncbi:MULTISPECIES: TonB-dependent copper receptor [Pseudomonas]|uniref:TonB-dependent copper receptor n=1 Tax=Pseudomonas quercus TaxID=2722792 RepID=A0ABX0YC91_9PSED|nr:MULTISPECIES: TonB-dependent copper receptor [Pseudomonas]MBF7142027.1 TonB-dependent copper receptor [Pseudomonas sp. LY10J]NJP00565.1 TonB-dependent copper receptor [Pseudomonas quercus]